MTTTLLNRRRIRALGPAGLMFAIACQPDLTEPERQAKPVDPPPFVLLAPGTVAQVSAGGHHSCALRTDGTVACWGQYTGATPLAGTFAYVSAGSDHTCGVKTDGTIACW